VGERAGLQIGRYEILGVVGSGSTGTVYRAHDPHLGRHLAVKLLHASSVEVPEQAEAWSRLLREARVLARLSHPNVVAAYDVGEHEGAAFIAMEFVEGASLRDWLAQPRRQADVLRVLIAAGRGLVAAHASGVLHHDFKPANVMVSVDGRVRVIDFGLARAATAAADSASGLASFDVQVAPPGARAQELPPSAPKPSQAVTRTSGVVGTAGFVPPEHWLGGAIDHRGDQFSYAVTAFVALTGQKPYPELLDEPDPLSAPSLARTPWPRSVPPALRRIVDRGLSLRPEQRYPSLAAMVGALERFSRPSKRPASWLAFSGVFAVSVLLPGAEPQPLVGTTSCNIDEAALRGVWDASQRERVQQAFLATGKHNAAEAFALVSQRLDAFRGQWLAMRRDSCEASLVRGEQPERVMVLRAACLDRALQGTKAFVGALVEVDAASMNRVADASPTSPAACADSAVLLGSADQLPADPAIRAVIDEVEVGLAVNQALIAAGRRSEALEQAPRIRELARTTQHPRTLARATAQLGRAILSAATTKEQRKAGEDISNESMRLAALAGDERLAAETASYLFHHVAYLQTRVQEGETMFPAVDALVRQAGNPPLPRVRLAIGQSTLFIRHNRLEAAADVLKDAIRLCEENPGDEFQRHVHSAAAELGFVYAYLGRFAEAEAMGKRGLDGMRRQVGAHHPRMLNAFGNLATLQAKAGHRELALETMVEYRALAASMPPDEPQLKYVPLCESRVWRITGDCARAIPLQREALAKFSAADGPDHPLTTNVMGELGQCLVATDQIPEAISFLERVLANRRDSRDAAVPDAAFALAQALWRVPAQRRRALSLAGEAGSLWRADGSITQADEAALWLAARSSAKGL
jgi:serine/threonine protein kinase/tetratricopeptide (TPR) repeat protein